MLLDTPVPNAAVFGSSHREATVIVSRGLLDQLDRDETQGVLAHLLGSAGNGDLVLLRRVLAVFQTYGLFASLGDAAFFRAAAASPALALLRFIFVHRDAVAAETVNRLLTRGATELDSMTDGGNDEGEPHPGRFQPRINPLVFTVGQAVGAAGATLLALQIINFLTGDAIPVGELGGVNFAFGLLGTALVCIMIGGLALAVWGLLRFFLWIYTAMFVLPLVALTWRGRRYLADATAVQLTRYPDGVARGLTHLAESGPVIPGTEWASHLFVVGAEMGRDRAQRGAWLAQRAGRGGWKEFQRANPGKSRLDLAREVMSSRDPAARLEQLGALQAGALEQYAVEQKTLSGSLGFVSFHPPLWRRLLRLRALGATVDAEDWSKESRKEALVCSCSVLVVLTIVAGFVALVVAGGS
jgi:Zn-dependent protease with chaperone function